MNSKAILLATAVFSAVLSASAMADSYYFRGKGSPVADASGNPDTPPDEVATASFGLLADRYRAGTTISGTLDTSLATPSWSFAQTPVEPSIGFATVEGGVSATAPAVEEAVTIQVTATASEGERNANTESVSVTVHPILAISGGPVAEITGTVNQTFNAQPSYVLKGLVDTASYALMQSSAPLSNFSTQCPGLTFSTTDGKISGTPTAACSLENLTVKVKDSFDEAETNSDAFSISIETGLSNVMAWGPNNYGQLGDGTTTQRLGPVSVLGGKTYVQVSAGIYHACGLVNDGTVECWGRNSVGQLGDGTIINKSNPVQVSSLSSVTAIAAGKDYTCAVISGGAVKCWGSNDQGQLGDTSRTNRSSPVQVYGLTSGVTAITAGNAHTCAIVSGGAKCWGYNFHGELGDTTTTQRTSPVQVSGLTGGVTAIAAGGNHVCALISGGAAKCWGNNDQGQLGDETTAQRTKPVQVSGLTVGASAIATGNAHTCAIVSGGAKCWGWNSAGQLGDTTTTNRSTPVQVYGLTNGTSAITTGDVHTCAIVSGGAMKCWGQNGNGQLGDMSKTSRTSPVQVFGLTSGITGIATGNLQSLTLPPRLNPV